MERQVNEIQVQLWRQNAFYTTLRATLVVLTVVYNLLVRNERTSSDARRTGATAALPLQPAPQARDPAQPHLSLRQSHRPPRAAVSPDRLLPAQQPTFPTSPEPRARGAIELK